MLRRLRIRTKLGLIMFVPVALIALVAGVGIFQAMRVSRVAERAAEAAQVATGPLAMIDLVQAERAATHAFLRGDQSQTGRLDDLRRQLDVLADRFDADLARARGTSRRAYESALEHYRQALPAVRAGADAVAIDPAEAWSGYSRQITLFLNALSETGRSIDSADLRREFEHLEHLVRLQDAVSAMQGVSLVEEGDGAGPFEVAVLLDGRSRRDTWIGVISSASSDLQSELEQAVGEGERAELDLAIDGLLSGDPVALNLTTETLRTQIEALDRLTEQQLETVTGAARSLLEDAANQRNVLLLGAAAAMLLAIGLLLLVGASVSRPLLRLAREAEELAHGSLPRAVNQVLSTPPEEEIAVPPVLEIASAARDEIGEVSRALDQVRSSALDLAVEQVELRRSATDSFVNLARRTQSLVARQLEFISSLEATETDPETLANLFELDHLATRMRRNAESLLVLAGVQPARTWTGPIEVVDVIRGAVSEVEDYRRVRLSRIDAGAVVGGLAADLSHLLAELLENALEFSPPDTPVTVEARRAEDGYRIAIVDRGIGMSVFDRNRANRRLAGQEQVTVAPARQLGHHVAGRLAWRIGAAVRIESNPSGGIVAMIRLPPELVSAPVQTPAPGEIGSLDTLSRAEEMAVGPPPVGPATIGAEQVVAATSTADPGPPGPFSATPGEPGPSTSDGEPGAPVVAAAATTGAGPEPHSEAPAAVSEGVTPMSRDASGGDPRAPQPARTRSGLVRRLPGANLPNESDDIDIRVDIDALDSGPRDARAVASLLSGFRSGVEQGRRASADEVVESDETVED